MTHNKANKSKILTLILGLTMCISLMLGIVFANPADTARAEETDPRTVVSKITATSNIDDIVGYMKSVVRPTFNIVEDVPVNLGTHRWKKYDGSEWIWSEDDTFVEGKYRYEVQIRTDNTTHVLDKNGVTLTVNEENWTEKGGGFGIGDDYSWDWFYSREYEITAPVGAPVGFIKDNTWNLNKVYQGRAIPMFSVASGATGGTRPYTFSKVTGPDWIAVSADGTVSGTPTALGANENLVIRVTDSMSTTAEITLTIADTLTNPDERIKISEIHADSNIDEIVGYGKSVVRPTLDITEGLPVNLGTHRWKKYDGSEWIWSEDDTFVEGKYRYEVQIRTDNTTHVLDKNGVTLTVNGENWTEKGESIWIGDDYSWDWFYSREYEITKPTTMAVTDELVPVTDLVGKEYNETAQEPTFGGTLVRGTDFEVSYAVKAGSTGKLDINGKPVGAGTYIVTVTGKGAYEGSFTKEFVIAKAGGPAAPILKGYAPTTVGGSDGKITGTTKDMEYDVDSLFTNPKDCSDGETTGFTEGTYFVRIKETDNYKASATFAVQVRLYTVTVEDGAGEKVTKHRTDDIVTITVTKPAGKALSKWVFFNIIIPDEKKETITFEMPDCDVRLVAVFEDIEDTEYRVTVTNGTASAATAKYQQEVTVTANEPDDDEYFDKWEVTGLDTTDMDLTKTEITFNMPAGNVTFKATYLRVTKYGIVVVDGTKDKEVAKAGETVAITANPAKPGKVFDKWTCETAGVTIEFESATSPKTTFVMPACEITIQAHFRDIDAAPSVEIKVSGGTGAGTYKQGDSVTVTAEDKEGKVFKGWQDASGAIVSTNKSYTFTVNGETTLTAVYEDAPTAKDGLSGGQIAGIVIGSVAVAGIGGFAVLWFAVKKKTFEELGVALKKGFTAIGNFFKTLGAKIKELFTRKK